MIWRPKSSDSLKLFIFFGPSCMIRIVELRAPLIVIKVGYFNLKHEKSAPVSFGNSAGHKGFAPTLNRFCAEMTWPEDVAHVNTAG